MFDLHEEFQREFFDSAFESPNSVTYIDYFLEHQFLYESQRLIFQHLVDQYNYAYQFLFRRGCSTFNFEREYEALSVIYGKICQIERETKVKYRNNCS